MTSTTSALNQLLARLGLTLAMLSERTGITAARLRSIYRRGNPTFPEAQRLLAVLRSAFVEFITGGVQVGRFNQAGMLNRQYVTINHYNVVIQINTASEPPIPVRRSDADPEALGISPQRWDAFQLQPGGQAPRLGPDTVVRRLGR
jgi:hypothetical protein